MSLSKPAKWGGTSAIEAFESLELYAPFLLWCFRDAVNPRQRPLYSQMGPHFAEWIRRVADAEGRASKFLHDRRALLAKHGSLFSAGQLHAPTAHHALVEAAQLLRRHVFSLCTRWISREAGPQVAVAVVTEDLNTPTTWADLAPAVELHLPQLLSHSRSGDAAILPEQQLLEAALALERLRMGEENPFVQARRGGGPPRLADRAPLKVNFYSLLLKAVEEAGGKATAAFLESVNEECHPLRRQWQELEGKAATIDGRTVGSAKDHKKKNLHLYTDTPAGS